MTGPEPIEAVVFDWGGTLTPWHEIDLYAQWYAYAEIFASDRAASLAASLRDAEVASWARQRDSAGAVSTGALDALFAAQGIDVDTERHRAALLAYLDFWAPHTVADPEAADVLEHLRDDGLAIGVLSNTMWPSWHHRDVFDRDGLSDLIDAACYTSEMSCAKPHEQAFAAIADALGVAPRRCVFVGDRLWDDVDGAQKAGMRAIWIPHSTIPAHEIPDHAAVPDAVASSLAEVVSIVRGWRADG